MLYNNLIGKNRETANSVMSITQWSTIKGLNILSTNINELFHGGDVLKNIQFTFFYL